MFESTITKRKIEILEVLEKRLGGKCSMHKDTCPHAIEEDIFPYRKKNIWSCQECVFMFKDIKDLSKLRNEPPLTRERFTSTPCPCLLSDFFPDELPQDVVVSRIPEYIEELERKMSLLSSLYRKLWNLVHCDKSLKNLPL
jgi:hypothetical protein